MRFIELASERLRYRKFKNDDFAVVFDWLSNSENMKYRRGEPRNEADVRGYLNWAIANADAEECKNFEFAVVLKTDNSLIGAATLMNLPDDPEIGWTLHRNYWRHGYGTEIGRTMLRLGFDTLALRRIIAGCNALNRGSYRIMELIGMRREARFIKAQRGGSALGNKWCDRLQYAILQEEWKTAEDAK
ncbi:MAG: GNAT family N-acetyltransferase [Synergistaceae bacterium]|jgi:RimJ/RimL family protein N-acetyltransferase|nr:GNAT family N-acetyltransferase [Synergistaceae bacterium]